MAIIKVYSSDGNMSVDVEVDNVSEVQYLEIKEYLLDRLTSHKAYEAISDAFKFAITLCPKANPSDIWQHIIYRTYIGSGRNDQSWKRASGQGFELAFVNIYNPRLSPYGLRLIELNGTKAITALKEMQLEGIIAPSKMDIAIEGNCSNDGDSVWKIAGIVHAKTSIAERIKDDAPASKIIMNKGYLSFGVTLDSKSYPPPHGNGINYGELGGRVAGQSVGYEQPKRNYFEVDGDFHNGYSYNLRTPSSAEGIVTPSGSRIKTLSFSEEQPDIFVRDIREFWEQSKDKICSITPPTEILS